MRFQVIFKLLGLLIVILLSGQLKLSANNPDIAIKQYEIDSLQTLLPRASKEKRIELLMHLSKTYMSFSMDSSMEYAKLALKSSREQNNFGKMAESYKLLGNISLYRGYHNEVIDFYDSSLNYYEIARDTVGMSKVWNNLGVIYNNIGDYTTSINFHLKSLECKKKAKDSVGIASSYNNIGSIYYSLEDFAKSYDYFVRALDIYQKLGRTKKLYLVYNNLGLISNELGYYDKAIEYFNLALNSSSINDNLIVAADVMNNIGLSNVNMGNYIVALDWYKQSLKMYEQLGANKSLVLCNMGQAYIELDYYKQALSFLKQALELEINGGHLWLLRDIYFNMSVAYQRKGDFRNAHDHYIYYHHYNDSVNNQQYDNRIDEITNKHEIEKTKEQIEKAQLENENRELELYRSNLINYIMIGGLAITLIFVIVLLRLVKLKSTTNTKLVAKNDEIMRSQEIIKRINKALTESEEKLRSIFDVSPYAIFVLDSETNIIDCNDTSIHLFKAQDKRELLDKNISYFVEGTKEQNFTQKLIEPIKANNIENFQFTLKRNDLSTFQAAITGRIIKDSTAGKEAFVVVINDITERLSFIENLKEAKINAEESDRLKTAFLANMSHEIRTPMNSIIGFSNLLNDPELKLNRRQEFISHILTSSNILLNLIEDIIDISKIEAGQMSLHKKEIIVNKLLREIFDSYYQSNTNEEVAYELNLFDESDTIKCNIDPVRLRQVLTNLISNAVKFTPNGTITIGYTINKSNGNSQIEFFVKDTGIGIPDDKQELIFDRFRQVDDSQSRKYGGTGLGLAISKRLVEIMGGSIWVKSKEGKGSAFYVKIPCIRELKNTKPIPEKIDIKKYHWKGKTLLLAEDENSNYQLVKAAIGQTGVDLIRVKNGIEAVNYVKKHDKIDLILMDIRMPEMNGYDATREIKKINDSIPIISITAYAMSEDETRSIKAGCDEYISKPIKPTKLLDILDAYLKRS